MTLLIWWKTLKEVQELARVKQVQELSDELMEFFEMDYLERQMLLPWILEARVMKNCPDMVSLSSKVKQLCLEINERTDDEQIHWLTDEILSLTK